MRLILRLTAACSCLYLIGCSHPDTLFDPISSEHSGIHFINQITENDSINPLNLINVYNGGGVGIGDFNNDGLQDIYFTGNMVSNKLYLNKGDFAFQDITVEAGVGGEGRWCRGVAVIDINNDGWLDMYVCATIKSNPEQRRNLLYINQGLDKNGVPHFKEMAKEYGLDDTLHSTMATFFDYDNDGDLDMYLVVNEIPKGYNPNVYRPIINNGSWPSTGHLFRNDWDPVLKHPVFTDVSKQAGITHEGMGHQATITDINHDGWKDIFVSNDFIGDDLLYINNHDGTFTNMASSYFKHTSSTSMGQDVEDINNDGLPDIVELDMDPEDNYRKKTFMGANNYQNYINTETFGYMYQYARNTLQLNQGPRVNGNDSIGAPIFSEIGFLSGIAETDWSWTPMVVDFDNDGYRDIIVTNGYPRDVSDHDFINFRNQSSSVASKQTLLDQIPQVKIHNYAFRNKGDLTFSDVSASWGLMKPKFSSGAAYVDLDNDGDLDLVINNINDEALIYRNTSREKHAETSHYLQVKLVGDSLNRSGMGALIELHYDHGKQQVYENTPYRGYLSTVETRAHFGLGTESMVDSVVVRWPGGRMQLLRNVKADQVLTINSKDADLMYTSVKNVLAKGTLFRDITDSAGVHFVHQQRDYIDFNIQKMLPHKLSEYGPALTVGDIDGNGLDDFICGGAAGNSAQLFLQQANGRFVQRSLLSVSEAAGKASDDLGLLLFDADGDGDLDLYITSGGYENEPNSPVYQDRLYVNDGKGNFHYDSLALPENLNSKLCVRAADYDHDGRPDLFVSGRVIPGQYPEPVDSRIYHNDSHDGHIHFTDVTATVAKDLLHIGMVCDASWTDFDGDGWPDLVLAGEWMPVTFLKNDKGVFHNVTAGTGIGDQSGWWNSIVAGDFDNDGDIDYVVGNLGLNSFYKASDQYPVRVYGKDFDKNGIYDMITSLYLPDRNGDKQEFPAESRDDLLKQMNFLRRKFPDYKSYAVATMDKVLDADLRKGALMLQANNFRSCLLRNDGNGKFTLLPLPVEAQFSVPNGMVADDFDGDGKLDLALTGNDYGTDPSNGRYDALNGLLLKGDGKGGFSSQTILQSGLYIPGNGKALVKLRSAKGGYLLVASQNRGPIKIFSLKRNVQCIPVQPSDVSALITYRNGTRRKEELYYGSSFLSQSGRFISLDEQVQSLKITNTKGEVRSILLKPIK